MQTRMPSLFFPLAMALPFCLAARGEEASFDLKIKLVKGATWKVEQALEINAKGDFIKGKPGIDYPFVRGTWIIKETWADIGDADVTGRPTSLKRSWTYSRVELEGKPVETLAMEGVAAVLTETAAPGVSTMAATGKSKLPELVANVLTKSPIELALYFVPPKPVKAEEEWRISAADICQFQRALASSLAVAPKVPEFAPMVEETQVQGESPLGCEVTARITPTEQKGEIEIKWKGSNDNGVVKMEIDGTLRWNVTRGRPMQLEFRRAQTAKANDDKRTKGWQETWKITRTWK